MKILTIIIDNSTGTTGMYNLLTVPTKHLTITDNTKEYINLKVFYDSYSISYNIENPNNLWYITIYNSTEQLECLINDSSLTNVTNTANKCDNIKLLQ